MLALMNRKLSDAQILSTGEELVRRDPSISGRGLRAELRRRYGCAGKTDRVFAVWRMLRARCEAVSLPSTGDERSWQARLQAAEERAATAELARQQAEERALRSESREIAHQDKWANEIHDLRIEVEQLRAERSRRQQLEQSLMDCHRERQILHHRLARHEDLSGQESHATAAD
jgi:hypothetical protein